MNLSVAEIFNGIQGEGTMAGVPMTFIRFSECNLRCRYCDSKYSWNTTGKLMSIKEIYQKVLKSKKINSIYLTGGEPLINLDIVKLVKFFKDKKYSVAIATNGSISPPKWHYLVTWVIDIKSPSAGVGNPSKVSEWGIVGRPFDEMKFVVGTQKDLDFVKETINKYQILQTIIVSPVLITGNSDIDMSWAKEVWSFCIENNLRFSLQLHKIIWGNRKGV